VRKSRYSDEQIAAALRQAELGTPIAEMTRNSVSPRRPSTSGRSALASLERPRSVNCGSCAKRTPSSNTSSPI